MIDVFASKEAIRDQARMSFLKSANPINPWPADSDAAKHFDDEIEWLRRAMEGIHSV